MEPSRVGWRATRRDQRGDLAPDQARPYGQGRSEDFTLNKIICHGGFYSGACCDLTHLLTAEGRRDPGL